MDLLITSSLLSIFGIFNIFGAKQQFFGRQLLIFTISLVAYFVIKKIGRNFFRINAHSFYWLWVGVLIITFVVGLEVKGSRRWIDLPFFNLQPSEFLKVFFILFLAEFLSNSKRTIEDGTTFLKSVFYFLLPTLIVFKQPDLGNAIVYAFIYITMLMFSSLPKKYIIYFLLIGVLTAPIGWMFLKQYQRQRVLTFFSPHVNQQTTSYNMQQAIITVVSGQFIGRGLGLGTQSKLYFLPENHTDFAFSSLVEQFGFTGGFVIIILFIVLIGLLIKRLFYYYYQQSQESNHNYLYIVGFLAYLFFQMFVNIGMNVGILPIAGIALPFVSYGGSSMLALFIGLALIP